MNGRMDGLCVCVCMLCEILKGGMDVVCASVYLSIGMEDKCLVCV